MFHYAQVQLFCPQASPSPNKAYGDQQLLRRRRHSSCGGLDSGLVVLVRGLLNLLVEVMHAQLPDSSAAQLLSQGLRPEMLLVLAMHHCAELREQLLRLFVAAVRRAPRDFIAKLGALQAFPLLGVQLHLFPTTRSLLETAWSLAYDLDQPVQPLEAAVCWNTQELPAVPRKCVALLLALTQSSVAEPRLCLRHLARAALVVSGEQ